jgi:hypothetical protein
VQAAAHVEDVCLCGLAGRAAALQVALLQPVAPQVALLPPAALWQALLGRAVPGLPVLASFVGVGGGRGDILATNSL